MALFYATRTASTLRRRRSSIRLRAMLGDICTAMAVKTSRTGGGLLVPPSQPKSTASTGFAPSRRTSPVHPHGGRGRRALLERCGWRSWSSRRRKKPPSLHEFRYVDVRLTTCVPLLVTAQVWRCNPCRPSGNWMDKSCFQCVCKNLRALPFLIPRVSRNTFVPTVQCLSRVPPKSHLCLLGVCMHSLVDPKLDDRRRTSGNVAGPPKWVARPSRWIPSVS